jgi:hypothetical protein
MKEQGTVPHIEATKSLDHVQAEQSGEQVTVKHTDPERSREQGKVPWPTQERSR